MRVRYVAIFFKVGPNTCCCSEPFVQKYMYIVHRKQIVTSNTIIYSKYQTDQCIDERTDSRCKAGTPQNVLLCLNLIFGYLFSVSSQPGKKKVKCYREAKGVYSTNSIMILMSNICAIQIIAQSWFRTSYIIKHNTTVLKKILEQQISIFWWFLKDHVILKTGVIAVENSDLPSHELTFFFPIIYSFTEFVMRWTQLW